LVILTAKVRKETISCIVEILASYVQSCNINHFTPDLVLSAS